MTNEVSKDSAPSFELTADGSFIRHRNVLFEEDEYVINIGPQHPATHGVLRFRVSLEGEIIRKLDVHCGYIHRGIEKMCEELTYPQTLALTGPPRLSRGAAQNRHALCMCIEKGLGVEVSERVQYIRTIMDELQRIDSHSALLRLPVHGYGGADGLFSTASATARRCSTSSNRPPEGV